MPSPKANQNGNVLNPVAAASPTDIWAVGSLTDQTTGSIGVVAASPSDGWFEDAATGGQHTTLIERFDGSRWTINPSLTKSLAQHLNGAGALPGTR